MSRMSLRVAKAEDEKNVSLISQEKWSTNLRERIRKLYKMGALRTAKMEYDDYPPGQYSFLSKRNGIRLAVLCNRCSNIYSAQNRQQLRLHLGKCGEYFQNAPRQIVNNADTQFFRTQRLSVANGGGSATVTPPLLAEQAEQIAQFYRNSSQIHQGGSGGGFRRGNQVVPPQQNVDSRSVPLEVDDDNEDDNRGEDLYYADCRPEENNDEKMGSSQHMGIQPTTTTSLTSGGGGNASGMAKGSSGTSNRLVDNAIRIVASALGGDEHQFRKCLMEANCRTPPPVLRRGAAAATLKVDSKGDVVGGGEPNLSISQDVTGNGCGGGGPWSILPTIANRNQKNVNDALWSDAAAFTVVSLRDVSVANLPPIRAKLPNAQCKPLTFGAFRALFLIPKVHETKRFMFKAPLSADPDATDNDESVVSCDGVDNIASSAFEWQLAVDDTMPLPLYRGRIIAEARSIVV